MAWLRLPRSVMVYLVVGLIISLALLTITISKLLRVDARDPKPTFPFLLIGNKHHRSTISNDGGAILNSFHPEALAQPSSDSFSPILSATHSETNQSPKLDFHTTSVGPISPSDLDSHQPNSKQETFSDTIVISPFQTTSTIEKSISAGDDRIISQFNSTKKPAQSLLFFPSFNSSFSYSRTSRHSSPQGNEQTEFRRNFVRDMMKHAWHGYANYAWGFNEVRPVSKMPHTEGIFGGEKLGASIVDGIDTLYIMGLQDEFLAARAWIENNLDFNKFDADLSVFETNIRYVGGLLSTYALTKDQMFLNKAVQIVDKLLPAFDTPSGVPHSNINVLTGFARNHDWAYGSAILSEFGSMHLEFIYLSHVTGDPKYRDKAFKIRESIRKAIPRSDGLYNNYMSTDTGQWLARPTHISMGGLGDSFYEYLIKAYAQSNGRDIEAYKMYMDAIKAFENKLIFTSTQSRLVYFAELKDTSINHKMDSLACFSGGMLALGATKSDEPLKSRHMKLASGIANTCHESCVRSKSHLGPETLVFSSRADAMAYGPSEKYYILRPEILETYFYMWRYTHDPKYREWAWDFTEALEKHCKSEGGYSGLRNVYQPVIKDDVQQSFFLAEVLKYLYLIFSPDDVIDLDDWVFNTEAHPFPILKSGAR